MWRHYAPVPPVHPLVALLDVAIEALALTLALSLALGAVETALALALLASLAGLLVIFGVNDFVIWFIITSSDLQSK